MTSDVDWNPTMYGYESDDMNEFHDPTIDLVEHYNPFNAYGEYRHCTVSTHSLVEEEELFDAIEYSDDTDLVDDLLDSVHPTQVNNFYVATLKECKCTWRAFITHPHQIMK
jgi:hypothetical protein